jgi:hypothetical protein
MIPSRINNEILLGIYRIRCGKYWRRINDAGIPLVISLARPYGNRGLGHKFPCVEAVSIEIQVYPLSR